ncbi:MAG: hypothetical protein ACK4HT_00175 [Thermus caldifontis]
MRQAYAGLRGFGRFGEGGNLQVVQIQDQIGVVNAEAQPSLAEVGVLPGKELSAVHAEPDLPCILGKDGQAVPLLIFYEPPSSLLQLGPLRHHLPLFPENLGEFYTVYTCPFVHG